MDKKILWDIIDRLRDDVNCHIDTITDLQAENGIYRNSRDKRVNMVKELKAENVRLNRVNAELSDKLQAVNDDYNNDHKVHNEYEDGLLAEIKELKAENVELKEGLSNEGVLMLQDDNKRLMSDNKKRLNEIIELTDDNKRLVKQVSSISSNSSSTHTHTISKEIAEYMSHNEGCMGARMFLIPRDEFKHGEYDNTIYWDDGME
jgi:FtsZ-binding cell division protein ZapB